MTRSHDSHVMKPLTVLIVRIGSVDDVSGATDAEVSIIGLQVQLEDDPISELVLQSSHRQI